MKLVLHILKLNNYISQRKQREAAIFVVIPKIFNLNLIIVITLIITHAVSANDDIVVLDDDSDDIVIVTDDGIDDGNIMVDNDDDTVVTLDSEIEAIDGEINVSDNDTAIVLDGEIEIEVIEGDIDEYPELLFSPEPQYPQHFEGTGLEGAVVLEMLVNEDGNVDSVAVIRSLNPILDACAVWAARQFKFTPARIDGEAVAVMLEYEYFFSFPEIADSDTTDDTAIADDIIDSNDTTDPPLDDDIEIIDTGYELTVYGREEVKAVARHRITMIEANRVPGLGGDAIKSVQAMPGVARPMFGGTEVVVRGAPSWASRYFIDGITVPLLYHMDGMASVYPSEALDDIDFYPGGFGSRYGGAVAGVIEMRTRRACGDSLRGYVDWGMMNGALFLEGPINDRAAFMLSARRNLAGDIVRLLFKHSDISDRLGFTIAPFSWDYLARTDVELNDNHRMYVSLIGSRDSLGMFIPNFSWGTNEIDGDAEYLNTLIMFHTLTMGFDSKFNNVDGLTNSLRISGTYARTGLSMFGLAAMDESLLIGHVRNQLTYKADDNVTVNIGADVELINADVMMSIITGQNMIIRDTIDNWLHGIVGVYTNVEWRLLEKLLLIPGMRYDYFPELNHGIVPSFRISGRYALTDGHTVKGAVGTYSQTPEPTGFVIHNQYGEPNMPTTRAAQYIAGHEWQITDVLNVDAQVYFNKMWNVPRAYNSRIDYDPTREIQARYFSDGLGRTYGLELMLRHARTDNFFGWASYTLSRSETWSMIDDKYILSNRDEPHYLQFVGSWKLSKNWEYGTRARFVSGKPTSPIVGTIEDPRNQSIRPIYGVRNSKRLDPFFQVDMRLDRKEQYNKYLLTYYIDLQNVLWPLYKSPEIVLYNYNYTEKQNISMIPLIAMGIRVEF